MDVSTTAERYALLPTDTAFDDIVTNAAHHPEHVAASRQLAGAWQPVTCRQLADEVQSVAAGLVASGISAGDRVALLSRTRFEWLVVDMAILSVGAVTVPIYPTSSDSQVEWILRDSEAVAVLVEDDAAAQRVRGLCGRFPGPPEAWTFSADLARLIEAGRTVAPEQVKARRAAVRSDDAATIVYTSGTTGQPKGCTLSHGNVVACVRNVVRAEGIADQVLNDQQSTLIFLPLAHIFARMIQFAAVHTRVRIGHLPEMKDVPAGLRSFRPTVVLSVPRVFEKIFNTAQHTASHGAAKAVFAAADRTACEYSRALDTAGGASHGLALRRRVYDLLVYRKLRAAMGGRVRWAVSGGAPLGPELGHFFRGAGITVLEGYGLTETTAGGTLNLPGDLRVGSVGRPVPGCTIRIEPGGEIAMKGPHVFRGYWRNERATEDVLDGSGWFRTGDVGHIDADGFVFITDRKKDLIVTSAGKNVAPSVLEDRLRASWLISQAAVFGDRKPYIAALLTLDSDALNAWMRDRGKPPGLPVDVLVRDPDLLRDVQDAVDDANAMVSRAEAIKRWALLTTDFTEATGELTPTLKVKRAVVAGQFAREIELLYSPEAP